MFQYEIWIVRVLRIGQKKREENGKERGIRNQEVPKMLKSDTDVVLKWFADRSPSYKGPNIPSSLQIKAHGSLTTGTRE